MQSLLLPVDAEQAVIDELDPYYSIGTKFPQQMPSIFLRVKQVGGFQRDLVTDTFTITLEAFSKTEAAASSTLAMAIARLQLAQGIKGKIGGIPAYRLQVAGVPQNQPLPSLPTHQRYTSTLMPDLRRTLVTIPEAADYQNLYSNEYL